MFDEEWQRWAADYKGRMIHCYFDVLAQSREWETSREFERTHPELAGKQKRELQLIRDGINKTSEGAREKLHCMLVERLAKWGQECARQEINKTHMEKVEVN